ncbi:ABC transporter permease [Sediminispirochaeta smaragdinae]|uniref:Binding-protein-dependent transport systems inner membrane component n=1 Tax=Sediminispirochaeta smaragdinae (strain DSM 11293 / JCM 15392 / SEBR 4228) TaxID=573413 RepID=E1R7X3_SEDSS|nr:ABC transporter permease [Sediminispirochaeta smaragdinae]ADK82828.1 binding-protein-dependent transport systems inner membrane component [Sediminispirochaeta smaragdinae DSM 11293]
MQTNDNQQTINAEAVKPVVRSAHPRWKEFGFSMKRLFKNPLTIIGVSIILFFAVLAIFAPLLAPPEYPDDPYKMPHNGWKMTPSPPSAENPLGTLPQQYDILYGIIWGARNAFKIGILVVLANLVVGIVLGALAGYFGGIVDEIIMRITDIFYSIPFLVMAMALVVAIGRGLQSIVIVLIILNWPSYTRVIRSEILVVRDMDYVQAAKASGAGHLWTLIRHVMPNSVFSVIIVASMQIGTTVLSAASLSFLGLGSGAEYADWGQMVSTCRNWIVGPPGDRLAFWYVVLIPGFTIALFVLGWNLLGDAIRDVFDPKMRRK